MAVEGASQTVTIANGASLSDAFAVPGSGLLAIIMPAAWTAAALTFAACDTVDGTFVPVYDDGGTEVTVASANVVASRAVTLSSIAAKLAPYGFLKLRSGTAASPVTQGAARSIVVQGR